MNKLDRVFIGPLVTVSVANITTAKPYARSVGLRSHLERVVKHWRQVFLQDISATSLEALIALLIKGKVTLEGNSLTVIVVLPARTSYT